MSKPKDPNSGNCADIKIQAANGSLLPSERFNALITEFCASVDLAEPERMINGVPFVLNQVVCSISFKSTDDEGLLFIHADFGEAIHGAEAVIYYALLRENFLDFSVKNCSFGISSTTGHIVFASSYSIDIMTPDSLLTALTAITWQAKMWRTSNAVVKKPAVLGAVTHKPHFLSEAFNTMP